MSCVSFYLNVIVLPVVTCETVRELVQARAIVRCSTHVIDTV